MQATNFGNRDDHAERRWLDRPSVGRILVERQVSASPVIVLELAGQDTPKVPFAEDENMIQRLSPDRADEALREGILLRAVWRRQHFGDPHALHSSPERMTTSTVAVADEVAWRRVLREGIDDLLSRPDGGGVLGHVEVEDGPAVVGEHDEDEEDPELSGRHSEEIDRD